jgi:hypothetical protein
MKITKRRVTKRNRIKRKYSKKRTKTRHSRKRVFSKKRRKTIKKKKRGGMGLFGNLKDEYNKYKTNKKEKKVEELKEDKNKIFEYIDELKNYTKLKDIKKMLLTLRKKLKTKFAREKINDVINKNIMALNDQWRLIKQAEKMYGGEQNPPWRPKLLDAAANQNKTNYKDWGNHEVPQANELTQTIENNQQNNDIINNKKNIYDNILEKMKSTIATEFEEEMKKYK